MRGWLCVLCFVWAVSVVAIWCRLVLGGVSLEGVSGGSGTGHLAVSHVFCCKVVVSEPDLGPTQGSTRTDGQTEERILVALGATTSAGIDVLASRSVFLALCWLPRIVCVSSSVLPLVPIRRQTPPSVCVCVCVRCVAGGGQEPSSGSFAPSAVIGHTSEHFYTDQPNNPTVGLLQMRYSL